MRGAARGFGRGPSALYPAGQSPRGLSRLFAVRTLCLGGDGGALPARRRPICRAEPGAGAARRTGPRLALVERAGAPRRARRRPGEGRTPAHASPRLGGVSAPCRSTSSTRFGSTWSPRPRHQTISRTPALAAFASVIGGARILSPRRSSRWGPAGPRLVRPGRKGILTDDLEDTRFAPGCPAPTATGCF